MKTKFATKSIAVFAALLVSALCALALPLRAAVIDPGAFTYRASFTVSGYAGSAPLSDFPVLVRISAASPSGFDYAACAVDGSDLRFSDADGNVIPHEIEAWDTAGESLVWVKLPEMDADATASAALVAAVKATPEIGWWLHELSEQPGGAAAISAFDGTADDLTSCYLVNIAPQANPDIDLAISSISVAPDGTVTLTGDLDVDGKDYEGTLNGTLHMDMWSVLQGDPTGTNLMRKSVSEPIVFPSGDWRFFRLKIE